MTATLPGLDALPTQPRRLRFNRYDGKRLPAGAKLVTRGTRWGNPHPVAERTPSGHAAAVEQWHALAEQLHATAAYVREVTRMVRRTARGATRSNPGATQHGGTP